MKLTLSIVGLAVALFLSSSSFANMTEFTCAIRTSNNHYLTAVGGGGRNNDVIHSDAANETKWEHFMFIATADATGGEVHYGLRTFNGYYLTAVGGGGQSTDDAIHSDATQIQDWERFQLVSLGNGFYGLRTQSGNYVSANAGGGLKTNAIHTDATKIGPWERFRIFCANSNLAK